LLLNIKVFKSEVAYYITNMTSEEVEVMSSEPKVMFVGMKPPMSYVLGDHDEFQWIKR